MKILIVQPDSGQMQKIISLLKEKIEKNSQEFSEDDPQSKFEGITVEIWDSAKLPVTCADIRKSEADLFINFDLAGFEQSTLTDGIAYNLLDCKQIHILLKNRLPHEKYLAKQLSISMFFYCADREYFQYLQGKYPDLPYLKMIEGWKREGEENSTERCVQALYAIVREVMLLCRMHPQ